MTDDLSALNEGELLWMARLQGLPPLRRDLPKETLVMIVIGSLPVDERFTANTSFTRAKLETFIQTNFERVRGQLPGCNGRCRSFPCTEGKHMGCFLPNEPMLL